MASHPRSASAKLGPPAEKPELIQRVCLSCNRKFLARGRFQRLCDDCRRKTGQAYLPQFEGW